jgi:hypothetical protein
MAVRAAGDSLQNVERVPAVPPETLDHGHLRPGVPVILTGLYDHLPAAELRDPAAVRRELGGLTLPIRANPVSELLQGRTPAARTMTFGEFHARMAAGLASAEFCIEHDTPDELAAFIPPPPYIDLGEPDDGWVSHLFLAGAGDATHLHFDIDLRNVLTYQVFGRKRYVLFDPAETRKLAPGTPASMCYASALYLEHFGPEDLTSFLRYANAWDCVLEPGELLVTPATAWHYIEYIETALSVTFRLARNPYLRFLAEALPPSVEVQALGARFRDPDRVGPPEAGAFAELVDAATGRHPDQEARAAALDLLAVELCRRLGLPIAGPAYHLDDIHRHTYMTRKRSAFANRRVAARR